MTTFVLLHGAWHGAWCWDALVAELGRRGHRTVAVDLPAGEPGAGAARSADVVIEALDRDGAGGPEATGHGGADGRGEAIVVVGHSMGGLVAPVVAERLAAQARPVRAVVFLAGLLPLVGSSYDEQAAAAGRGQIILPGLGRGVLDHGDDSSTWVDLDLAVTKMCPDAPHDVARAAVRRLRRQYWTVMREVSPLRAWPDVDYASIVCVADAVVNPVWGRQAFRDRFHVRALELPGDHSPFLSRPAELADLLVTA